MITHWKVVTHDRRSPLQGGKPLWRGRLPVELPEVIVDDGPEDCAPGWHCASELVDAFRIAGLWPDGRPSLALAVEPHGIVVERGDKVRSSRMTLSRQCSGAEVARAIDRLSEPFGPHAPEMAAEQMAWRRALARPRHDPEAVEHHLREALAARGLDWRLDRHVAPWAARAAWDAWAARDAWAAWATRATRAAKDAWAARAAWDAAWHVLDARDARDALLWRYAALTGWVEGSPAKLTVGIREAYATGLGLAVPTAPGRLAWAMDEQP